MKTTNDLRRLIMRYAADILLGLAFPLFLTLVLLNPILLHPGIPFYGDEEYYLLSPRSFYFGLGSSLSPWTVGSGSSLGSLTMFSYSIPLTFLVYLFGQEIAVKLFILVVASLPGIFTYFALRILSREWQLAEGISAKVFSLVGALFMLISFTNFGIIGAATSGVWPYATLPLSFALFVRYLKHGLSKDLLMLCALSLFAITYPFWIYLVVIMSIFYIGIEISSRHDSKVVLFKRLLVATCGVLSFNAFWLLPVAAGYLQGASGPYSAYTTSQLISFQGLKFLSHWNLLDVLMNGEHQYYFFWLHPQNYGPLNVAIPVLAVASVLIFRKSRYVLFMALALVVGLFLTKGVWEPGGYLYYLIASALPYGAGAILRNPTGFVPLVTFSYAFLIGLFIAKSYKKLCSLRPKKHILTYQSSKPILVGGLVLLVLSPVTYGTLLDLQGYTWQRYNPTYVPQVYDNINSWLSKQEGNFKVMWIPSGGAYVWKPYIITAFPDLYSSRPSVSFSKIYPEPLKSVSNIGELLKALGVKYVIYHGDSLDYPNDDILGQLTKQNDLKQVLYLNYTYNATNNSKASLPVGTDIGGVPVEFKNIPFIVFENEDYVGQTYIASGNATILSSKYINPVEANVVVHASTPFTLIFTEPFDRLWRAYANGKEVNPEPVYGAVNGFEINGTGTVNIRLYYTLQNFYYLGWFVSGASSIVLTVIFVCEEMSRRISERQRSLNLGL